MDEYGWIDHKAHSHGAKVRILASGWEEYDRIIEGEGNLKSPAFVAMWFGGSNKEAEQEKRFDEVFRVACKEAGWLVKRGDSVEHNEPIIDRIIAMIRQAPFVIADITENNDGVYFEAGYAKGLGKPVMYCCPNTGVRPHFDISGFNQVRYDDEEQLRVKLRDRIIATVGEGKQIKAPESSA